MGGWIAFSSGDTEEGREKHKDCRQRGSFSVLLGIDLNSLRSLLPNERILQREFDKSVSALRVIVLVDPCGSMNPQLL